MWGCDSETHIRHLMTFQHELMKLKKLHIYNVGCLGFNTIMVCDLFWEISPCMYYAFSWYKKSYRTLFGLYVWNSIPKKMNPHHYIGLFKRAFSILMQCSVRYTVHILCFIVFLSATFINDTMSIYIRINDIYFLSVYSINICYSCAFIHSSAPPILRLRVNR